MLARWTLGISVHLEGRWILPNKTQSLLKIERTRPPGHGSVLLAMERPPVYVVLAMFYLSSLMLAVVYLLFFAK
jgi:hypothetical protein